MAKKVPVALRMDAEIKAAGTQRAKDLRRTFTAYVEWLIHEDVKSAERAERDKK